MPYVSGVDTARSEIQIVLFDPSRPVSSGKIAVSRKAAPNAELARLGYNGSLERANGYFYFRNGEVVNWLDRTVSLPTLNSLTLEQWMEDFRN